MNKTKPTLKKVNIDAHIKNSKVSSTANIKTSPRGRGRPRKNPDGVNSPAKPDDAGKSSLLNSSVGSGTESPKHEHNTEQPIIIPQYDTTEEAKGILKTPFALLAMFAKIEGLNLDDSEVQALLPSWKVVYDKRIAPSLGENADIYVFATVFIQVSLGKYVLFRTEQSKRGPIQNQQVENVENNSAPPLEPWEKKAEEINPAQDMFKQNIPGVTQ